jgi:hypothetical protein
MAFRKPQTIKRKAVGAYVDGVWIDGATSQFTISASVQPLSDQDLVNLPSGRRESDIVKMYCADNLLEGGATIGQEPDILVWLGKDYEITSKSVRQMGVLPHYRYWCAKVSV